jgi:hypothetical protein
MSVAAPAALKHEATAAALAPPVSPVVLLDGDMDGPDPDDVTVTVFVDPHPTSTATATAAAVGPTFLIVPSS